jgi:hypothetical protein
MQFWSTRARRTIGNLARKVFKNNLMAGVSDPPGFHRPPSPPFQYSGFCTSFDVETRVKSENIALFIFLTQLKMLAGCLDHVSMGTRSNPTL